MKNEFVRKYFEDFESVLAKTLDDSENVRSFSEVAKVLESAKTKRRKVFLIGNGGSAAIAEHMAIDLTKNAGLKAIAFSGSPQLTTLSNDLGFEKVFEKNIQVFAEKGDVLLAISSGGRSKNIHNGVKAAREKGCVVVAFSGFDADNPLRKMGDHNFYVPSHSYGYVELIHNAIIHCLNDQLIGTAEYKA